MVNGFHTYGSIILFLILLLLASLSFYFDQQQPDLFSSSARENFQQQKQDETKESFIPPPLNKPTKRPTKIIFASRQPTPVHRPPMTHKPTILWGRAPIHQSKPKPPPPPTTTINWKHNQPLTLSPTRAPVATRSPSHMNLPTTDHQCTIDPLSNESCSLSLLQYHENLRIFPSINSGCGCIESYEKYSFIVTKGDPKNLLIYFQGGGLCWDQISLNHQKCRTYTHAPSEIGILDRTQSSTNLNPFSNYTTVTIPYCTGDFFLGNSTDNYYDSIGEPVQYKGRHNAQYILEWIQKEYQSGGYLQQQQQQQNNETEITLDQLVLAGSSAGSIGVLAWSSQYSQVIPAKTTIVLADSLLIYSPPSYASTLYQKWNFCSSSFLPSSLVTSCQLQQLQPITFLETIITSNPHINYYFISSKRDWTALALYNAILLSFTSSSSSSSHPFPISPLFSSFIIITLTKIIITSS